MIVIYLFSMYRWPYRPKIITYYGRLNRLGPHIDISSRCQSEEGSTAPLCRQMTFSGRSEHPPRRASWLVAPLPDRRTIPPITAKPCRGWYQRPSTSLEVSFPLSRTSTPGVVWGKQGDRQHQGIHQPAARQLFVPGHRNIELLSCVHSYVIC